MKKIKIKKDHQRFLDNVHNEIKGIELALESLSLSLLIKKKAFWEIIRKEYEEIKKEDVASYDSQKHIIEIYSRLEAFEKQKEIIAKELSH